jgi:ribonuclease T2
MKLAKANRGMLALWMTLIAAIAVLALPEPEPRADSLLSGTLTATKACPAFQSFRKSTNPGDITITAGQSYQLVAGNTATPTHLMIIVRGATPDRRWVAIDCGTQGSGSATAQATPAPATAAAAPAAPIKGSRPTQYVFSISWEPGFCAGKGGQPECGAETPSGFDASHFTLHGLWPDPNEYCGAAPADIAADKAGNWSALPAVDVDAPTRAHLDQGMPGTQSQLERHEWIKHGTCSGVSMNIYFGRALSFLDAVNASPVQALFVANAGKTVTLDAIRAAFDQGFGPGAGQRIRLSCPRQNGVRDITEITIGLTGDVLGSAKVPDLITAARPTNGGCDAGTVVKVGN